MTVIYASAWSSGFLDFLQVSATTTSRGTYGHQHFAHGTYTAPSEQAAKDRFAEFTAEWGQRYPAIVRLWESFWAEFVPFLEYDVEIRRVICTTNAIESINARYRRAVRARGHFPNETAALKCLYLVTRSLDPTGGGPGTLGDEVEACAKRVRDYLRGPVRKNDSIMKPAGLHTPFIGQSRLSLARVARLKHY